MKQIVGLLLIGVVLCSCRAVGPDEIRNSRMAYNEAIIATNNQQLLMVAIHDRYEENASLLMVASVTANMHTTSKAAIEAGFGGGENYRGNLVPFSAGITYEENPTISYVPVAGTKYTSAIMAPVSIAHARAVCRHARRSKRHILDSRIEGERHSEPGVLDHTIGPALRTLRRPDGGVD